MHDQQGEHRMTAERRTGADVALGTSSLTVIKRKAVRRGVWFRTLTRSERGIVDLTVRIVKTIRSRLLMNVIERIVTKLQKAMESNVVRLMREVGQPLARKLSMIAQTWGNKQASVWIKDRGFIQFLAINHLNSPS